MDTARMTNIGSWSLDSMPHLAGKTIAITGANSGIGFECARIFARAGAHVVMGCRSAERAGQAVRRIHAEIPKAKVEFMELDLANLASIRAFADQASKRLRRIDILCNNAGIYVLGRNRIRRTWDGYEAHFGINHLGHFALTGLLLHKIQTSTPARIVTVSSMGRDESAPGIDFDDLQCAENYSHFRAYANSKLANLLFAYELDRRLRAHGFDVKAVSCTPGPTLSNLGKVGEDMHPIKIPLLAKIPYRLLVQSTVKGALSEVYAAVGDDIDGADHIGRGGSNSQKFWIFGTRFGRLRKLKLSAHARDAEAARRLWTVSEELTGVRFLD